MMMKLTAVQAPKPSTILVDPARVILVEGCPESTVVHIVAGAERIKAFVTETVEQVLERMNPVDGRARFYYSPDTVENALRYDKIKRAIENLPDAPPGAQKNAVILFKGVDLDREIDDGALARKAAP